MKYTRDIRDFLRRDDGAHGAEYAVLSGLVACALVLCASIFGPDISRLIGDLTCDSAADCAVPAQGRSVPKAPEGKRVSAGLKLQAAEELKSLEDMPVLIPVHHEEQLQAKR